ncbi:putative sterol glucosyltransferase [Nemania abortiva]|nr:putative sterol glucosyltransferase [Nemania abortiva]
MANQELGHSVDDAPAFDFPPATELDFKNPGLQGDGRIDIDLDSSLVKYLSVIQKRSKAYDSRSAQHETDAPSSYSPCQEESRPFPIKLNIVIQVIGSRGDVQPFVALGNELQKHGHRVRLATHNNFDPFVRDAGLEFYPVGGDPVELMAYMVRNPGLIPSMKSMRAGDIQKKRRMMADIFNNCWLSCIEPDPVSSIPFVADAIIANPPSFAHVHCAQALGIPVHLMFTMPWSTTTAFPHPLANIKIGGNSSTTPHIENALSYSVVEFLTWQGLGDIVNEWRDTLDLEPVSFSDGPNLTNTLKIPFTFCWSPALVPKPADWGPHIDVCGFFFREPVAYSPPKELEQFIQNGAPPIYIGFGSIVIDDPQRMSTLLLEAIQITGVRALISRGWSNLGGAATGNVMYLGDCPHEWLFQHVAAVIHHGGAGTTACGLLNGLPTAIVPFFGDQPFWGEMVAASGAGPKPIFQHSLAVDNLVEAIRLCMKPETREAAQKIAAKMKTESGVKTAVASFHANLPTQALECDVLKGQPAAWIYSGKVNQIKLSKVAVEILTSHDIIDQKRLKMNRTRQIVIETRRWDPVTGTTSAAIGSSRDIMKAAADIIIKPAKVYRDRAKPLSPSASTDQLGKTTAIDLGNKETISGPMKRERPRDCMNITKSMTAASASSTLDLLKSCASSVVTIPYAFTEGFRNIPRLYGEDVRDIGVIRDWKSGTTAGAKIVVYGIADGISGLFALPYQGAQKEGASGAIKGVAKGIAGLSSKAFAATIGMATYPLQGIYQSIWASARPNTRQSIILARRIEGFYLASKGAENGINDEAVIRSFTALNQEI